MSDADFREDPRMFRTLRRLAAALGVAALLATSVAPAFAAESDLYHMQDPHRDDPSTMWFDVFITRPLGLATTALGVALMAPAAVIMTVTGHPHELPAAWNAFVEDPAEYTYRDPIGTH
jgi:hypothetical protein